MKRLALLLCCLLAGCESTRQFAHDHPVATGLGLSVLATSIAMSANHGGSNQQPTTAAVTGPAAPPCTMQPNGSCR